MSDSERKVSPGERLGHIQAKTWNELMVMLRWFKRSAMGIGVLGKYSDTISPHNTIWIQNFTGQDFTESYRVVRLDGFVSTVDSESKYDFGRNPSMGGYVPDSIDNNIAILQKPLDQSDEVAPAVVNGVTLVNVRLVDTEHKFARPVTGVVDYLESAESGQAAILDYIVESGSDEGIYLALVNLSGSGGLTGTCDLANLKTDSCLQAKVSYENQTVEMQNTGEWEWTSATNVRYPCGTGPLVLTYIAEYGIFTLFLDGRSLAVCAASCWKGGRVTGHIGITPGSGTGEGSIESGESVNNSGCSGGSGACEDGFTVCMTCVPVCSVTLCCGTVPRQMWVQWEGTVGGVTESGAVLTNYVENPAEYPTWLVDTDLGCDDGADLYVWKSDEIPSITDGMVTCEAIRHWVIICCGETGYNIFNVLTLANDDDNDWLTSSGGSGSCDGFPDPFTTGQTTPGGTTGTPCGVPFGAGYTILVTETP